MPKLKVLKITTFAVVLVLGLSGCRDRIELWSAEAETNKSTVQIDDSKFEYLYLTNKQKPKLVGGLEEIPEANRGVVGLIGSEDTLPKEPTDTIRTGNLIGIDRSSKVTVRRLNLADFRRRSETIHRAAWRSRLVVFLARQMASLHDESNRQKRVQEKLQRLRDIVSRETPNDSGDDKSGDAP